MWDRVVTIATAAGNRVKRRARGPVLGFLILLFGIGFVEYDTRRLAAEGRSKLAKEADRAREAIVVSGNRVAVDGCNRDFRETQVLRGVMIAARQNQRLHYNQGEISYERWKVAKNFYNSQLKRLVLPDCRKAQRVLSDDPNKVPSIPKPLRPNGEPK